MTIKKNSLVNTVSKVDKVEKIRPSTNNTNSDNFTLSNTHFYDKLKRAKKGYDKFYIKEQQIDTTYISKEKEPNQNSNDEYIELLKTIKNLIVKYNMSILYIKKLDIRSGEYYIRRISSILLENQNNLSLIGITLNKEYLLEIDEKKFNSNINENKEYVYSFFDLDNGLIKKIHNEFKNIKNIFLKENINKEGSLFNEKYQNKPLYYIHNIYRGDFLKKLTYILTTLIVINFFVLIPICYDTMINKSTVNNYLNPSQTSQEKEKLKKEIIKDILSATKYEKWNEYIDYIDLKIYRGNVLPNKKENIIFVLNMSKDTALIAVYENSSTQNYIYKAKITDLVSVKDIKFFRNFIVIEQILDERLGAFFLDNFVEVFYYDNNGFKSTFKKSILYDEVYKDIWINKNAPNDVWTKTIKKSSIDYLDEDIPKILSITTTSTYKAKSVDTPKEEDFKEIGNKSEKELYVWDEKEKEFKLYEKSPIRELQQE